MISQPNMAAFEAQLRALQDEYARQFTQRLARIEATWQALLQSAWDSEIAGSLQLQVHSIAGASGTLGFVSLSMIARGFDRYLHQVLEGAQPPGAEQCRQVEAFLVMLRQVDPAEAQVLRLPGHSDSHASVKLHDQRMIWLIQENPQIAGDLATQLGYFGYTVQCFAALAELPPVPLSIPASPTPDAIVMTLRCADGKLLDGESITALRARFELPPPLLFTAQAGDIHSRLLAVRAGGAAYFTEPVDVGALIDMLDRMIMQHASDRYRILVIDDEPALATYFSLLLSRSGMEVTTLVNPLEVLGVLADFKPDLILMDMYMAGCTGLELAAVVRQQEAYLSIPIVFLSAEQDVTKQLEAMSLGGDDFLTKPINAEHLVSAVTSRVRRARVLRSMMVRDSLTGLFNHTVLKEQLELEVARARRMRATLSFALLDIDRFKSINDTYGHPIGDRVIKSLSRLLQQRLRKTDIIGRYGGEEFAVILPDTDGARALEVLNELRIGFSQIRQYCDDREFYVTFSCGIACLEHDNDAGVLNDAADKALYRAKHAGRNRVELALS